MKFLKSIAIAFLLLKTLVIHAQVGIGTNSPNASAQLDITSTSKGLLPPRMTYAQRQAITSPAAGLIIWCSDCVELQVYSGTAWTNLVGSLATGVVPALAATTASSNIDTTSASSGGNITADGGTAIIAKGICWSTSESPTTALSTKTSDGTGTGSFTSSMTGLSAGTTYYVRAYATNGSGTGYGAEMSFTTLPNVAATTTASSITCISATSGGSATSDAGSNITARGVCWALSTNPTVSLSTKTADGSGSGSFISNLTGLSAGTTYYVRAYATNGSGTAYGDEISFTTVPLPTVSTTTISSVTGTSASSGGTVSSDSRDATTTKGICWSTSHNPTADLSTKTTNGSGAGSFTSSITGLTPLITYYVRAYATNSGGTAYGEEVSFTTILSIGDSYQGGKVAYILQSGDPGYVLGQTHGVIAAAGDIPLLYDGIRWGCFSTFISGASGTALGTGNQNTIDIVAGCNESDIAAKQCSNLVSNGYSDWYLPSKDELHKLYLNRTIIGGFNGYLDHGFYTNSEYLSSSQSGTQIWMENFSNGSQYLDNKYERNVRPVRSF